LIEKVEKLKYIISYFVLAALTVEVGTFSDPYEAQGLAHFLGFP